MAHRTCCGPVIVPPWHRRPYTSPLERGPDWLPGFISLQRKITGTHVVPIMSAGSKKATKTAKKRTSTFYRAAGETSRHRKPRVPVADLSVTIQDLILCTQPKRMSVVRLISLSPVPLHPLYAKQRTSRLNEEERL